jgi:hypothetical protein
MKKTYSRQDLLDKLTSRFSNYSFELKEIDFQEQVFIKSESHKDFKTTIVLGEYPLTEDQLESICGILEGTIQLLKHQNKI